MEKFNITIASIPDKEKVVAEIWYGDQHVAEINQESEELIIELYPTESGDDWRFNLIEFQKALDTARTKLKPQ